MSAVVYDNDAYLAYVMTVDEESLGADATPALPPADTEISASTITSPLQYDPHSATYASHRCDRDTAKRTDLEPTLDTRRS